jgi:hypothetical protein
MKIKKIDLVRMKSALLASDQKQWTFDRDTVESLVKELDSLREIVERIKSVREFEKTNGRTVLPISLVMPFKNYIKATEEK